MHAWPKQFVRACMQDLYPVVSTTANFDEMLVPPDHISRSPNDTYYVSASQVMS